ncbi:hypothetical protein BDY21DRAFT_29233 [Lineolata rhizophorae]|uniref:Uncharacterized protein n=1 Tax=Lineolata rhizophorae TaxID=578093 RepID=A0A6A6P199_9PEZI|nr:hypothetical protein BDY21DRAFT_29233 [Lineolata rhizophorae]
MVSRPPLRRRPESGAPSCQQKGREPARETTGLPDPPRSLPREPCSQPGPAPDEHFAPLQPRVSHIRDNALSDSAPSGPVRPLQPPAPPPLSALAPARSCTSYPPAPLDLLDTRRRRLHVLKSPAATEAPATRSGNPSFAAVRQLTGPLFGEPGILCLATWLLGHLALRRTSGEQTASGSPLACRSPPIRFEQRRKDESTSTPCFGLASHAWICLEENFVASPLRFPDLFAH